MFWYFHIFYERIYLSKLKPEKLSGFLGEIPEFMLPVKTLSFPSDSIIIEN